jgi:hypothetical protein
MLQTVDIQSRQITESTEIDIFGLRPVFINTGTTSVQIYNTVVQPGGSFVLDMGDHIVDARIPINFAGGSGRIDIYYGTLKA